LITKERGRKNQKKQNGTAKANGVTDTTDGEKKVSSPKSQIFVVNCPYKITEKDIQKFFAGCGQVKNIIFLKKKDGLFGGQIFVEFSTVEAATKAVALSGKDLEGRVIKIVFSDQGPKDRGTKLETPETNGTSIKSRILFGANFPFGATDHEIHVFFAKFALEEIRRMINKETGKWTGNVFLQFSCISEAEQAKLTLDEADLKGKNVRLSYSEDKRTGSSYVNAKTSKNAAKKPRTETAEKK